MTLGELNKYGDNHNNGTNSRNRNQHHTQNDIFNYEKSNHNNTFNNNEFSNDKKAQTFYGYNNNQHKSNYHYAHPEKRSSNQTSDSIYDDVYKNYNFQDKNHQNKPPVDSPIKSVKSNQKFNKDELYMKDLDKQIKNTEKEIESIRTNMNKLHLENKKIRNDVIQGSKKDTEYNDQEMKNYYKTLYQPMSRQYGAHCFK